MRGFLGFSFGEAPSDGYVLTFSAALGRYAWAPVVASSLTGLTAARLVFGSAGGGLSQDSGLTYDATAGLSTSKQITSTLPDGTAPLVVASTTQVANLNASQLIGGTWAVPGAIGSTTKNTGAFTTLSATGVITSTLATGTAPFTVASTTVVGNLNASQLLGGTWAAPGAIGGTTPAAGAFTTLSATGTSTLVAVNATGNIAIGTSDPFSRGYGKTLTVNSATDAGIEINAATGQQVQFDLGINATRLFTFVVNATSVSLDALTAQPMNLMTNNTTRLQITAAGDIVITSGSTVQLGNAYVATPQVCTGYVTLKDSAGTTYKVLVAA